MDIQERVKSFEDACTVLSIEPIVPDFSFLPESEQKAHIAHYKLIIIAKALNEGWTPDWSNDEWDKWFPWFYFDSSSSAGRFSFDDSGVQGSFSDCGSRLCYKTSDLAEYAGTQFEDLYRDYFVIG